MEASENRNITGRVALLIRFGIIRMVERYRVCGRGWRKQDFQWVEFVLERLENTVIWLRRLSREEARPALA